MKGTDVKEVGAVRDFAILLRAVSTTVRATEMLYVAASQLTAGRNATDRAVNKAVITMTVTMLGLPEANPEMVERVLRSLPDIKPFPETRKRRS